MVKIRVPATIANFGPAFDALGVAVSVYNTVELDVAVAPAVSVRGEGQGVLPADATNLVYRAAEATSRRAGQTGAFAIRCDNGVPIGRGLGSSAAAIVGGAVAANETLGRRLGVDEILDIAWKMEGHPDNVAAALLGGAVLAGAANGRLNWTRIVPAWTVALVVAVPEFTVSTERARAVLPDQVPLRDAVANLSRTAWLVTAMLTGRSELLASAMADSLHQPYRKTLVPGMEGVFAAAREGGAYAAALCGSGPSVVAVSPPEQASSVGRKMVAAFEASGSRARFLQVRVDEDGATRLSD